MVNSVLDRITGLREKMYQRLEVTGTVYERISNLALRACQGTDYTRLLERYQWTIHSSQQDAPTSFRVAPEDSPNDGFMAINKANGVALAAA
jgi:hypothetical protein